ncbi:Glycosyltransferase involved in cell wall bisynthesis [Clostridium sp. USBA 49]|uniref:glycosyltransferase family 4 protein n=1 Tax=Clostridium sp. USBA 49 TaxID=1881060 RepID=UPI00099A0132|nr:glycosyltransferase family 1 protein [Clostridium sp. USBA 49]SKA87514.1 Glycosyltransferase involved in cell wall bisynthesis [Clostridium sp. USBA 49]
MEYKNKAEFIICKSNSQIFCEQIWIPFIVNKVKPDVIHFPAFPPGLLVKHKNIIFTLHDATMWKFPETISYKNKLYMKPLSEIAIKKSKYIFTVSNNSKENICSVFNKYTSKVVVTGESISEKFNKISSLDDINNVKNKFNTGERYILSVCSLEPRKNIPKLLTAFSKVIQDDKYKNIKLVLVGRRAWGNNIINQKIQELNLNNNVVITGYISDEELIAIYNGAYCFIYPSIYEGFGLPILEAMACGIPVITSNVSSIPEVAGDSAILINPNNENEMVNEIKNILSNDTIRMELINKGYKRLEKFSWIDIVKKMIRYYREACCE